MEDNMKECKIAAKLSELRIAKGVTQDEVAGALSVSNKTVSKWENGASSPDLSMIVSLARYYNVSTDVLLGLEDEQKGKKQVIADAFTGLHRQESVLKIFEIIKELFPASFAAISAAKDDNCDGADTVLPQKSEMRRYQISVNELFDFAVCSDEVNLAVALLRSKSDFAWLLNEEKQSRIVRLFGFLADAEVLKIMSFIHSTACSKKFTVNFMSKNAAVPVDKATEVLEMCCEIGVCSKVNAHLKDGEVTLYESLGDGLILSLISIAYERMCGKNAYEYNYNESCKMIGGKKG